MRILFAVGLLHGLAAPVSTVSAERRVALVLGSDEYETIRPLNNAVNDALAVRETLKTLNFEVFVEANRNLSRMRRALDDFVEDAAGADVALIFFAGHGVEIAGVNRLLPTDASTVSLEMLINTSLPLEELQQSVAKVADISLIVLDACRNDPFAAVSDPEGRGATAIQLPASVKPGLGRMGRSENTLFAFSAAPGETASEGDGDNSPFTRALTKYLGTEGLEIRSVLTLVQQEVYERSGGQQLPYIESGLPELFFASQTSDELPERERLLLAMANVTPTVRDQVERIATDAGMPLAPLYGALISNDLAGQNWETRQSKMEEVAQAFVNVREEQRRLRSNDERVTALRSEAEEQLSLGAFEAARAKLTKAEGIDAMSRETLNANMIERTLSEADTHYLKGSTAKAELRYQLAIADYENAVALYKEVTDQNIVPDAIKQQFRALEALGNIQIIVGNLSGASTAVEAQFTVAQRLANSDPSNTLWQRDLSVSFNNIGVVREEQGDLAGALAAYQASFAIRERLASANHFDAKRQSDLSVSYSKIGGVRFYQGSLTEALTAYEAALAIRERLVQADPTNTLWQGDLASSHRNVGNVRILQGDLTGALDAFRGAFAICEWLVTAEPSNNAWQMVLSDNHESIGDVLAHMGNLVDARTAYELVLAIRKRLVNAEPENTYFKYALSVSYERIGDISLSDISAYGAT